MRHYRLNMALLLVAFALCIGGSVWLLFLGLWPQGTLALIAACACTGVLWHLQGRLIRMMSAFVSALEMNDTTMRVEADGDDELRMMSAAMNRISELYHHSRRELEIRKLYYDRILKIMTHEMRNSISPVIAVTADMVTHPERYRGETLTEAASLINSQTEGIHRFLDSYYKLTHLPKPEIECVNAADYFNSLKRIVATELQRRCLPEDIVTYIVPEDMPLRIDIGLFNQVMVNLIRNALDAIEDKNGRVQVVATVSDSRPVISVIDNGSGIDSSGLQNLFQPFYSTKPGGSGVGLSLSRQIVRSLGGELNLQTLPGKGTTLIIRL